MKDQRPSRAPGDSEAPSPREALRTLPLDEGTRLRDELGASLARARRPTVVVLAGREVGSRCRLDGTAVFGRDPGAELVLTDAGVSWRHCRVEDRGDEWVVIDLGSTNGTSVNGQRRAEAPVSHGDRIVLGRTVLRFELQDSLDQAFDEHLHQLLTTDDLSGLYVRRHFDAQLARALESAQRTGAPLSLLVMDMDGIKALNDRHGHLFGAYVIGETGKLIGRALGARGFGARFGGDEFLAALPGVEVDGAFAFGEELCALVGAHPYEREGVPLRPGISIGVAAFPAQAATPTELFQRADEAMYRAKQAGRHRVAR